MLQPVVKLLIQRWRVSRCSALRYARLNI